MTPSLDPLTTFRLKPIRSARVSEISETTAAAPVANEDRVNFHIGNPLQDPRLSSAFLRIALGLDVQRGDLRDADPDELLEALGWDKADKPKLEFLIRTIQKSSPYMPRGGYARKTPNAAVKAFVAWLENQQDALKYDTGEQSARREIILGSGGVHEALRVLLWALSSYLEITPARILCYRFEVLPVLRGPGLKADESPPLSPLDYHAERAGAFTPIPNLIFEDLATDEATAREQIEQGLIEQPDTPTFLLLGEAMSEEARRWLRKLSTKRPLLFIEVNNAPNHLSLAREAKLVQRVIRLLTPAIFNPQWDPLSTVFIAGNADILNAIENVHFNLKGTPSASEIEFLSYLLEHHRPDPKKDEPVEVPQVKPLFEGLSLGVTGESALPQLAERIEHYLDHALNDHAQVLERALAVVDQKAAIMSQRVQARWHDGVVDEFSAVEARELFEQMIANVDQPAWNQSLQRSFLGAFVRHQPQYRPEACVIASGSSRTALGIVGFHCGITDVVIPDLSWSYEQCFPNVHAVPLTPTLELDADGLIAKIEELCAADPTWPQRGAVAVNNPHNATGRIFAADAVRKLITYCLERGIYVVDDLAYQNVAPVDGLPVIKTARQHAEDLVYEGALTDEQAERVLTVHSMSKTDCLAGARLAVVEIRDAELRERYQALNANIQPNLAAVFICYLFYRNSNQAARTYWHWRNAIFAERTNALMTALQNLPPDRNPFGIKIIPPTGSMYPLLQVAQLPAGLSLDWLASSLARTGIGLLPLATFARTEKGFETGRTTFRLTLGGVDGAEILLAKTRRLLIDLNRLIAEEEARYNRRPLRFNVLPDTPSAPPPLYGGQGAGSRVVELTHAWESIAAKILQLDENSPALQRTKDLAPLDAAQLQREFVQEYVPQRLEAFRTRLLDRALISDELMTQALSDNGEWLAARLEREFMKDSLERRQKLFTIRSYDRTVHPTQVYGLPAEMILDTIVAALIARKPVEAQWIDRAAQELAKEFLGQNVAITSENEADEILLDLGTLTAGEDFAGLFTDAGLHPILSFWSDWDGSNRPSGQGHRLAAAVVMENVRRLCRIMNLLREADPDVDIEAELLKELDGLPKREERFTKVLNEITSLTHQLEQRYRSLLPYSTEDSWAVRLHVKRDPAKVMWQHNDRYERKMLELRQQRRQMLEDYFALNKRLRKQLHSLIPAIQANRTSEKLLREVVGYHDILQRTVITPRIGQGMITARDQFAINTTVFNLNEINAIAGKYGNPGMMLAMQVSLSTKPEALISLDRKLRIQHEQTQREYPGVELPWIWLIPLFEDLNSITNLRPYLDRVWEYAAQSRNTAQSPQERFADIIPEVFVAGSDLSQQVSQARSAFLYRQAKYDLQAWAAERQVAEVVRIKLGSGEPMQRQGGYYSHVAGEGAFIRSEDNRRRFVAHLPAAARRSTAYAVTPLQGIFLGRDLRTLQSNISEQLRLLPVRDFVALLYHVREAQHQHRRDLIRAAESIAESRLSAHSRSVQELERLTIGMRENLYEGFLEELTENFRHILYGREEDVIGIHAIAYFIGRSSPQWRDRPTSRRTPGTGADRSQQILANIAEIIPLSKQGSLLRAIAHNQAQTVVLGINQLTTGLFRALERFAQKSFAEAERERLMAERLLPHLPVYEILNTLRLYQDWNGDVLKRIEPAFPAGNSAFVALREDTDARQRYLPLFQQELLRRHGVNVNDFFVEGVLIPALLPTLRPDLAVLLQSDLSNTSIDQLLDHVSGRVDEEWRSTTTRLLQQPRQIQQWRSIIWDVMGDSIYQRVQSFTELATAIYAFSANRSIAPAPAAASQTKLSPKLSGFFRTARADDEMRNFLLGALEYLGSVAEGNLEVPVAIIRAMNDVERLAQIEESALPAEKQDVLRHCLLQIARLAGENG